VTEKIWTNLQKKNNSKDSLQPTKKLNPDPLNRSVNVFGDNIKNSKNQNNEDLAMMENKLSD
jgi:hypothetical protein